MYTFNKNLETGNVAIDTQHKELINAINELLAACSQGKGRDTIEKTSRFLLDYTKRHFKDEELLQLKYSYPDYVNHKKYHAGFVAVVNDIVSQLKSDGATIVLVSKINSAIATWLINHITVEDAKVAQHIKFKAL